MEWGHPLAGLERVQGAGQWFGRIHRAAARNLPSSLLSPAAPSPPAPTPTAFTLMPVHLMGLGLGHTKPGLLMLPTPAAILLQRSFQS